MRQHTHSYFTQEKKNGGAKIRKLYLQGLTEGIEKKNLIIHN